MVHARFAAAAADRSTPLARLAPVAAAAEGSLHLPPHIAVVVGVWLSARGGGGGRRGERRNSREATFRLDGLDKWGREDHGRLERSKGAVGGS